MPVYNPLPRDCHIRAVADTHRAETSIVHTGSQVPASGSVKSFSLPPEPRSSVWLQIAACWMALISVGFSLTYLIPAIGTNTENHFKTHNHFNRNCDVVK